MITEEYIEALATKLADPGEEMWKSGLTDHLDDDDADAVHERANLISIQRSWAGHTDSLESLIRLAHATGCPDGEPVIPWLQQRDLIEEVDGGWRFKAAKPGAVT